MVFIRTFITTLCFYDFCKTVLVKKCTPCTLRRRPSISGIFVSQLRSAFRSILLGLSRGEMDAVFGTDVALNIALQLKCC